MCDVLFEVWRGRLLESVHRGRYAVVDGRHVVAKRGDVRAPTYLRSAAKPFQARGVVESGAADGYGFTPKELAVMCGSHHGEDPHLETVRSILGKAGLRPSHLRCGVHAPYSVRQQATLARRGEKPNVLHNNCSGKHAGMIATARHLGARLDTYLAPTHPIQRANLRTVADFAGLKPSEILLGVDGCSAPAFGMPLVAMARAFSRLAAPDGDPVPRRIAEAMTRHPDMVGHPCQELMSALPGRILGKVGAEGVYGAAVLGRGIGVAVKIEDGNSRALLPVVVELLRRYGGLSRSEGAKLSKRVSPDLRNRAGLVVGRTRVVVDQRSSSAGRSNP